MHLELRNIAQILGDARHDERQNQHRYSAHGRDACHDQARSKPPPPCDLRRAAHKITEIRSNGSRQELLGSVGAQGLQKRSSVHWKRYRRETSVQRSSGNELSLKTEDYDLVEQIFPAFLPNCMTLTGFTPGGRKLQNLHLAIASDPQVL